MPSHAHSFNPYAAFKALLAPAPLQIGMVQSIHQGVATIELPGGALIRARGQASTGQKVFVRGGLIEGAAPDLPVVTGQV